MKFFPLAPMLALLGSLLITGCALQPSPQFYQLDAGQPALPTRDKGPAVLLGPLKLADYLQRENLLQRESDGRLQLSQEARWAGSLEDDVGQLLVRQLAGRLDSSRVALYPDRVGFVGQWQVVLTIGRLDSGVSQPAVLEAQWRILDAAGSLRDSRLLRLQAEHDGAVASQVKAQSQLLQQLAGELATPLGKLPVNSPPARATGKSAGQRPASVPKVAPPLPVPQAEVYRF